MQLEFSVDRVTVRAGGMAFAGEAAVGQAYGDIYTGTTTYVSPGAFAGKLPPAPFAGVLPAIVAGPPGNVLTTDESVVWLCFVLLRVPA